MIPATLFGSQCVGNSAQLGAKLTPLNWGNYTDTVQFSGTEEKDTITKRLALAKRLVEYLKVDSVSLLTRWAFELELPCDPATHDPILDILTEEKLPAIQAQVVIQALAKRYTSDELTEFLDVFKRYADFGVRSEERNRALRALQKQIHELETRNESGVAISDAITLWEREMAELDQEGEKRDIILAELGELLASNDPETPINQLIKFVVDTLLDKTHPRIQAATLRVQQRFEALGLISA